MKSWLAPLYVEVKAEGDAEIPIVDLEHIRNMNFYANMIGLVRHGNVHAGIIARQADIGGNAGATDDILRHP